MSKNFENNQSEGANLKKTIARTNKVHLEPLVDLIQHLHNTSYAFPHQETENHTETAKSLQAQTEGLALALLEFTDTLLWETKNPIKDRMVPVYVDSNQLGNEDFISNRYVVRNTSEIKRLPFSSEHKRYMSQRLAQSKKGIFVDQVSTPFNAEIKL